MQHPSTGRTFGGDEYPISRCRFVFDAYQVTDRTPFAQYASLRKRSGMDEMKLKSVISTAVTGTAHSRVSNILTSLGLHPAAQTITQRLNWGIIATGGEPCSGAEKRAIH